MAELDQDLVDALRKARKIAVLSGAGLSAESGVPTFRGPEGLWKNHDPTELATAEAFRRDPALVWEFYNWRREKVLSVEPNGAHRALVDIEARVSECTHITQNVDGLSQRAGARRLIELHGNLFATICFDCRRPRTDLPEIVPHPSYCECGGLMRPGVVWFGESVPAFETALAALPGTDLFLVVGTSALVQPAASLAMIAKQSGAHVAEFNLEPTPLTASLDFAVHGPVGTTLPALMAAAFH
ncbi:MAG: NAD-dependent deacylase [Deltaproteobacteria bacterium]|nr:NAD-dependent deacylase [Deltaproteobacteria bacterium]